MKRSLISAVLLLLGIALLTSCDWITGPRETPKTTVPTPTPTPSPK